MFNSAPVGSPQICVDRTIKLAQGNYISLHASYYEETNYWGSKLQPYF